VVDKQGQTPIIVGNINGETDRSHSFLLDWKHQLFSERNISTPDGRHLYAYRLTEAEFVSLETALGNILKSHLEFETLGSFANSGSLFCSLFVLYAAEWWRRRYDGSRWSWGPILADLNVFQENCWSVAQRGECIERGLRGWRLRLSETSGLRYLGSVAVQGGLPMQLLAEAKGNLGRMLSKVLKLSAGGAEFKQVCGWIENLGDYLPKSYQREEIYFLLAEVITTVFSLKREAKLTKSANAITQLDQQIPQWRERFPLSVEDGEVQGLIEQLIRDVTEDQEKRMICSLTVERLLERQDDEIWKLYSNIAFPEILATSEIRTLFDINESDDLSRSVEFVIELPGGQRSINARKIAGHDRYRLERRPCEFVDQMAMNEHRFSLRTTDSQCWSKTLRKGEPLDTNLPWIFEQTKEGVARLVRQGGGSVQAVEVLVAIPCGWKAVMSTGISCPLKVFVEAPDREVYVVNGRATITDYFGHRWTIRTGQADATEESFQWSGDRMWIEFIRPAFAFRGKPGLHMICGEEGVHRVVDRSVSWGHSCDIAGPVKAVYEEKGELRHQAKMVLLPRNASVEYQPIDANRGIIHLRHWKLANANLEGVTDTDIQLKYDGDTLSLHCVSSQSIAPEWLELELAWEQNSNVAQIRLPFPAEGASCFDAMGVNLAMDSWLSIQSLAGVRLVSFCRSHMPVTLIFRLRHTKERENEHEVRHRIPSVAGVSRLDIRLQNYAEEIERLLAADELLDAWVEVALSINNKQVFSIRVSRYACRMERVDSDIRLGTQGMQKIAAEVLDSLPVYALRLEQPGEEAVLLQASHSEGVATGVWEFASSDREPGSWLIYPGSGTALPFRPTLWLIPGETAASTPLACALAIENRQERAIALDSVIEDMSFDFLDPSWGDMERLAGHLGHLPLATLDVWRRFVHSPSGMAALVLRRNNFPDGFLRRFSLEQPFVWELVPFKEWRAAAECLKRQCIAWFGEELVPRQLNDNLSSRIAELTAYQPALGKLLGIVKSVVLEDGCKKVGMMRDPASDSYFQQQLFASEKGAFQRLIRDHANDTWPSDSGLFYWVNDARNDRLNSHLFPGERFNFKDGIIGLPILLAIQVSTNTTGEWFKHPDRIHILRTYKAFDPDWFADAFDLTIARCLSTGVMQLQEFNNGSA